MLMSTPLRIWFFIALTVIYVVLAKSSLAFAIPPGNASAIWPPAGLAVAACLLYGYRAWGIVFLGATIVNASTAVSLPVAIVIGIGDTLETLTTAWLINRYINVNRGFSHSEDIFKFVCFALFGALIASTIGPGAMLIGKYITVGQFSLHWLTWMLGDLSGMAIVTPAMLAWKVEKDSFRGTGKRTEFFLFCLTLSACITLVFKLNSAPLLFLLLPLLIWLAFRYSQSEVTKVNVVLAIISVWATMHGMGPLASQPVHTALLILQVFVSVIGITGLAVSVAIDERSHAVASLTNLQNQLEKLVQKRTAQLEDKDRQLVEAQHLAHLGSWCWIPKQDHLIMSEEMARIYGVPLEERNVLNYKKYLKYIPPEECHLVDEVVQQTMATLRPFSYEHHVIRPDGTVRFLRCRGKIEIDEAGNPVLLLGTAHDVTEEKALENNLREAEELYRKLVEVSPDAIYLLKDMRFTFSNSAGLKLLRINALNQLVGHSFLEFVTPEDRQSLERRVQDIDVGLHPLSVETRLCGIDKTLIDIDLAATIFSHRNKHDTLVVARDISERKHAEQQIQYLAHYDYLTNLPNRILFKERAEHAIAHAYRTKTQLAVMFVDLDRFKSVNDTSGHSAGDQVLRECAQRLSNCVRDTDTVARAGGDEFLILLESISESLSVPIIANKIIATMRKPFNVDGQEYIIGASVGISTYPADGADIEALIGHADMAMYRAKTESKGNYRYYSESMSRKNLERYQMENALRRAVEYNELVIHFQPKFSLHTGSISGAEALIRWHHPQFGLLLPDQFVSVAEDLGLIGELGLWTIREVCKCIQQWRGQGLRNVRIAVNVSYSQFADEEFCDKIDATLRSFELPPAILELELTETVLMQNADQLMYTLKKLKDMGIRISVDDFGTGYSSLAYLKRLPVDSVKIDRSFISDLPGDADDVAITHAVLALVHSLKRSVVAEGVETRDQLHFLLESGCDEVQGFYFSAALPSAEFKRYLNDTKYISLST